MLYELEKRIWTDEDYENMGWHDNHIYNICLGEDLELDIDYIINWNNPEIKSFPFTFWISPSTLVFKKVQNFTFDFRIGFDNTIEIEDIEKPCEQNEYRWSIITHNGDFQFNCNGYEQFIRQDPFFEFGQIIPFNRRGGICLDRTITQNNNIRFSEETIKEREVELEHFENAKRRYFVQEELDQLTKERENNKIDTKNYLLKNRELKDRIFSYNYFLKGTRFEDYGVKAY